MNYENMLIKWFKDHSTLMRNYLQHRVAVFGWHYRLDWLQHNCTVLHRAILTGVFWVVFCLRSIQRLVSALTEHRPKICIYKQSRTFKIYIFHQILKSQHHISLLWLYPIGYVSHKQQCIPSPCTNVFPEFVLRSDTSTMMDRLQLYWSFWFHQSLLPVGLNNLSDCLPVLIKRPNSLLMVETKADNQTVDIYIQRRGQLERSIVWWEKVWPILWVF